MSMSIDKVLALLPITAFTTNDRARWHGKKDMSVHVVPFHAIEGMSVPLDTRLPQIGLRWEASCHASHPEHSYYGCLKFFTDALNATRPFAFYSVKLTAIVIMFFVRSNDKPI